MSELDLLEDVDRWNPMRLLIPVAVLLFICPNILVWEGGWEFFADALMIWFQFLWVAGVGVWWFYKARRPGTYAYDIQHGTDHVAGRRRRAEEEMEARRAAALVANDGSTPVEMPSLDPLARRAARVAEAVRLTGDPFADDPGDDQLDRLAKPGDRDLDLSISILTITSVVAEKYEIMVGAYAVFGHWEIDGQLQEVQDIAMTMAIGLPDSTDDHVALMVDTFTAWRDRGTPLEMYSAPDRMTTLVQDDTHWLPIPRREPGV